jgi:alkanesulfonate monooxygenase SsuD/methylene tetrahydromethanopterin reductase-like flavin-dependent oxidoreductase (luciferase family)
VDIGLHYSLQSTEGTADALIERTLEEIARADDDGFSSAVFAEHHFFDDGWVPRPMLLAAAAAAGTKRLRVGPNIVILPLHHPVAVAEEAAVLDLVSGGRAVLGVGLGWIRREYAGFGVDYDGRARLYERSLRLLRRLLAGETVDSEDDRYPFSEAAVRPLPPRKGGPPLRIAGVADHGVRRAARLGDAWMAPPGRRVGEIARLQNVFSAERERRELPPATERPVRREVFVAGSDLDAWKLFAAGIRHEYGVVYRAVQPTYPDDDSVENLRRWGEDMIVAGSVETVVGELRRLEAETGATEVLVRYQLPGVPDGALAECFEGLREVLAQLSRG